MKELNPFEPEFGVRQLHSGTAGPRTSSRSQISLLEALTGFKMAITKLDQRTLVIQTKAGQVISPSRFDPSTLAGGEESFEWEAMDGCGCSLPDVAKANSDDVDMLKTAIAEGQLRGRGIGAFVIHGGQAVFKQGTRAECLAAKTEASQSTLYVMAAPRQQLLHCVEGEGLPGRGGDPFQHGNLFLQLDVVFPTKLSEAATQTLQAVLPGPLNQCNADEASENVDSAYVVTKDPVQSFQDSIVSKDGATHEEDDDDDEGSFGPGCAQM